MNKQAKSLAAQAKKLWNKRDLQGLVTLWSRANAKTVPEVWFYAGLAFNGLNNPRKAIECWRQTLQLDHFYEDPIRALAYELKESNPLGAADLFSQLVAMNQATADDLTALGEIRIRQDRLGEAQKLLEKALEWEPDNSLALIAMATVYAHVRDRNLAIEYLRKVLKCGDLDISNLQNDPEFEFLWSDREFEKLVAQSA